MYNSNGQINHRLPIYIVHAVFYYYFPYHNFLQQFPPNLKNASHQYKDDKINILNDNVYQDITPNHPHFVHSASVLFIEIYL